MFSYSSICESGLFDNKDIIIVHPDFDKIVLIDHINKFFFGVSEIPITNCMQFFDFQFQISKSPLFDSISAKELLTSWKSIVK